MDDFFGCILERLKSSNQDICQEQQPFRAWIMLIEASKNLLCKEFAEDSTAQVDCLMMGGNRLLVDELCSVDKKAVD